MVRSKGEEFSMFCVIYRWEVGPENEARFVEIWSKLTKLIRANCHSLGSRLHREGEKTLLAYAQWPDRATWEMESLDTAEANILRSEMQRIAMRIGTPLELEIVSDLLLPTPGDVRSRATDN